ncbi:hypothetical protein M8J76_007225 [Diaphorina citri]|nr:hypothetical protein M8J75_009801 [Diaphorina citri]KAI5736801.1 hypothetical protein M8J76_007225 [Diaphorina citri]
MHSDRKRSRSRDLAIYVISPSILRVAAAECASMFAIQRAKARSGGDADSFSTHRNLEFHVKYSGDNLSRVQGGR